MENLDAALPHLRRPFAPEAIKFKVQNVFPKNGEPKGCIVIAYIDVRLVVERLNAVVGGAWSAKPQRVADNGQLLWCELEVFGRTRLDIGASSKGMSKDLWSDAQKRAAVPFGVGVSVYALPEITLYANQPHVERREKWDAKAKAMKPTLVLTAKGLEKLHDGYRKWLEETGIPSFGPVLDHGDVFDDFDPDAELAAETDEEFAPVAPAALEDDKAVALQEQARGLYAEIAGDEAGRASLPPARFDAWLRQSSHSHEALEQLIGHLQTRRDAIVGAA